VRGFGGGEDAGGLQQLAAGYALLSLGKGQPLLSPEREHNSTRLSSGLSLLMTSHI